MTRAYVEGYTEGRFGSFRAPKCPHAKTQEANEWSAGYRRGLVIKSYAEGEPSSDPQIAAEVRSLRAALGERV